MLQQFVERDVGLVHQGENGVDRLAEIVRRDVGRHADRDAAGAVDEQIGKARRQDDRLFFLLVIVRLEVDGVVLEIVEQSDRDRREPRLGVALRRGRVAVDRAEIALPVDERRAHREVLRHAHERVVDRKLAVRVILTDHVADGARRLVVGAVGGEVVLVHRIEDAPVHGLQAVANVGQSAAHDHAHRVIEIAAFHFVEDRDGLDIGRSAGGGPFVNNVGQWEGILDANRVLRTLPDSDGGRQFSRMTQAAEIALFLQSVRGGKPAPGGLARPRLAGGARPRAGSEPRSGLEASMKER